MCDKMVNSKEEHSSKKAPQKLFDDASFIESCIDGNRENLEKLARACLPSVRKLVYLGYGNRPDTEDVTQKVLVVLFRDLPTLKKPTAFRQWLYRVTCNVIYSHGARRSRWQSIFFSDAEMDAHPSHYKNISPEKQAAQTQVFERVSTHLEKIKHRKRMAVILSTFFGYVDSEIADIVGCSTETAKKRVQAGRKELINSIRKDPRLRLLMEEAAL